MLAAADLDGMRATLDASLPDTCAIVSGATVPDGAGGSVPVDPESSATVACRVSPASELVRQAEAVEAARIASQAPWVITFPHGTSVSEDDRVTSGGRTFEVAAVFGPRSFSIDVRVLCREIK